MKYNKKLSRTELLCQPLAKRGGLAGKQTLAPTIGAAECDIGYISGF